MKLSDKQQKIVDIVQWILIVIMMFVCTIVFVDDYTLAQREKELKQKNAYIKIYDSHKIDHIERENKMLKDSILILNERLEKKSSVLNY